MFWKRTVVWLVSAAIILLIRRSVLRYAHRKDSGDLAEERVQMIGRRHRMAQRMIYWLTALMGLLFLILALSKALDPSGQPWEPMLVSGTTAALFACLSLWLKSAMDQSFQEGEDHFVLKKGGVAEEVFFDEITGYRVSGDTLVIYRRDGRSVNVNTLWFCPKRTIRYLLRTQDAGAYSDVPENHRERLEILWQRIVQQG